MTIEEEILEESEEIIRESCHTLRLRVPLEEDSIDGKTMKMLMHNVFIKTRNKSFLAGKSQKTKEILEEVSKILNEYGDKWEIPIESGGITGEFNYIQFKESPVFKALKQQLQKLGEGRS